jgi:hypothetical protein
MAQGNKRKLVARMCGRELQCRVSGVRRLADGSASCNHCGLPRGSAAVAGGSSEVPFPINGAASGLGDGQDGE